MNKDEDRVDEEEYESDCEDYEDYKQEGYHPVYIGESFKDGRYVVVQKLGWGHFSTVWLAEDRHYDPNVLAASHKYVALKVQKSKPSYAEAALDEIQILKTLSEGRHNPAWTQTKQELGSKGLQFSEEENFAIDMLDNFPHFGMHGKHYCSTFPIMGPNLLDVIRFFEDHYGKGLPIFLVKKIAIQLLLSLDYMHRVCKIIHTDLKPENVMIELPPSDHDEFIKQLKSLKVKPLSMKYIKAVQSNSSKNKKKKKKKLADQTSNPQGSNQTPTESDSITIQGEQNSKSESMENNNKITNEDDPQPKENPLKIQEENLEVYSDSNSLPKLSKDGLADLETKSQPFEDPIASTNLILELDNQDNPNLIKNELDEVSNRQGNDWSSVEQGGLPSEETMKTEILEVPNPEEVEEVDENRVSGSFSRSSEDERSSSEGSSSSKGSWGERREFLFYWKEKVKVVLNEDIKIRTVDFGNACWTTKHFTDNIQTREYRSPEAILGSRYEANTDVWSAACLIFELLTGEYLFRPSSDRPDPKDEQHLALFISTLGKIPKKIALEGKYSREVFNKNGKLLHAEVPEEFPIEKILVSDYKFDPAEAKQIQDFMTPMLEYDVDKRISAQDILKHPWLWTN